MEDKIKVVGIWLMLAAACKSDDRSHCRPADSLDVVQTDRPIDRQTDGRTHTHAQDAPERTCAKRDFAMVEIYIMSSGRGLRESTSGQSLLRWRAKLGSGDRND